MNKAYYTAFTSETLTGDYVAESDSVYYEGTASFYRIDTRASTDTKFVKVMISPKSFAAGFVLPK